MEYKRKKGNNNKYEESRRTKHVKAIRNEGSIKHSSPISGPLPKLSTDVLSLILARLPAAVLQRFRCVCKSWDSLVRKDRHFASLHLELSRRRRRLIRGLVSLSYYDLLQEFKMRCSLGACDPTVRNVDLGKLFSREGGLYTITNSCNGLIGVCGIDSFCIVNPSIRRVTALPQGRPHIGFNSQAPQAGLGFDSSTGEYKVVRLFHRGVIGFNVLLSIGCEVISLGGNGTRSWRSIDDPPGQASYGAVPVAVNGSIYWDMTAAFNTGLIALSFDLSQEKFGVLTHPEGSSRCLISSTLITELGGRLCVAYTANYNAMSRHMDLWFLKDPKNSCEWVKEYQIDLSEVYKPWQSNLFGGLKPVTLDNRRILLCNGRGWRNYYNLQTGRFGRHKQIAGVHTEYVSPYAESIIWPWS